MSSDQRVLAALASKTRKDMRYFDFVQLAVGPTTKKCFACLGKHSLVFMSQSLNSELNKDGEVAYLSIIKVVEDTESDENFLVILAAPAQWPSDRLMVRSDNRDQLMQHLQCCWQTDYMWRLHKVARFPRARHALTEECLMDPAVEPFRGFAWRKHRGYEFMLPHAFLETANAMQSDRTGQYFNADTGVSVTLEVHDLVTIERLTHIGYEHIRWVAAEYKAKLVNTEGHFYLLRNCTRAKRMNLAGDIAAWYGWEQIIRTRDRVELCMNLRRQYIPPLCDCVQDIAVIVSVPVEYWRQEEAHMVLSAGLIADSCRAAALPSMYLEIVQAKLDGLRFDEEGFDWVSSHVGLKPRWRYEAKVFVRTLLSLFVSDAPSFSTLPKDILLNKKYLVNVSASEEWSEIPVLPGHDVRPLIRNLLESAEGLEDNSQDAEQLEKGRNLWHARLARYFAGAVDGGLLGARFNLERMIEGIGELEENREQVEAALMFLLHMREVDPREPWVEMKLREYMERGGADRWVFNDRVMQQIISCDHLKKIYGRTKNASYFEALANLLRSKAGVQLKAYICRIFMETRVGGAPQGEQDAHIVPVGALIELFDLGNSYLATYACAALVNLSHANEHVKMQLMSQGMAPAAAKNLASKDDDLINYTLTLLVNVTKEAHHRSIIANAGILPLLYDTLTSSYHQCKPSGGEADSLSSAMLANSMKEKILTHLCSIVGHFCKDEEHRDHLVGTFEHIVKCFVYIATHAAHCSDLMGKCLFALKQLCAAKNDVKRYVGPNVLKPLCRNVFMQADSMRKASAEFMSHVMQLLLMLAALSDNCMILDDIGITPLVEALRKAPGAGKLETFEASAQQLTLLVNEAVAKAYAGAGE